MRRICVNLVAYIINDMCNISQLTQFLDLSLAFEGNSHRGNIKIDFANYDRYQSNVAIKMLVQILDFQCLRAIINLIHKVVIVNDTLKALILF